MSTLLKWAENTKGKLSGNKLNNNNNNSSSEKKWIHPPEALKKGHIVYLVKFLGYTAVDEPSGIEVVKEAILKLRFNQQLKKSENGAKIKKIELTISVDGVAIQEPRSHLILHQYPLHQISYCADDKGEKKFFSFIAKLAPTTTTNNENNENENNKHLCFVFISDKLAEEITLTIGQAFELAYKKYLENNNSLLNNNNKNHHHSGKSLLILQQKTELLQQIVDTYKERLTELHQVPELKSGIDHYLKTKGLKTILQVENHHHQQEIQNIIDLNNDGTTKPPAVPPRNLIDNNNVPQIGTKLEGLLLNELDQDDDFDPRSFENSSKTNEPLPLIAPPPKPAKRNNINLNNNSQLLLNEANNTKPAEAGISTPNSSLSSLKLDPFEMGDFRSNSCTSQEIENAIGLLDKRILEMKAGFSRGITFGNDDFSLESLDPLKN